ncbi:MAG: hypothetical protein ACKVOX_11165, partial [Rhizobacter sp.]
QQRHFVTLAPTGTIPQDAGERQRIAVAARDWYTQHSLARQSQGFARACQVSSIERPAHD